MYLLKNAIKSILRAKTRNILVAVIALVITVSACIALSIRQSAETAKNATLDQMQITAQITVDRQAMMKAFQSGTDRASALQNVQNLTLEDLKKYAESQYVSDFYYTITSSFNADENVTPVDITGNTSGSADSTDSSNSQAPGMGQDGGRRGFGGMGNQGDFTVVGYSSHNAMTAFMEGTSKVVDGTVFDESTAAPDCIISDELATLNDLKVGDTITMINPNDTSETVEFTISGIYNNSESTVSTGGNMGFNAAADPANRIYMSYNALKTIVDNSKANATVETDEQTGREISTALRGQESGTYVFTDVDSFNAFKTDAASMGLDDSVYTITSPDLNQYEQSLVPLERLSSYASYFLLVVLVIGGAILVVFNVFAIRERKYEIGVLAAIGMNKMKVAVQFISEVFLVTFIAIILGAGIGSAVSAPVANRLLADQVATVQASEQTTMNNFGGGFQGRMPGGAGFFSGLNNAANTDYISTITANVDVVVLLQLFLIGILLTLISSAAAVGSILRYDPLKILSNRS